MRAVALVLALADVAFEAGPHLCTYTYAIALLDFLDVLANVDSFAHNLMADTQGALEVAPSTCYGVNIGSAHTATLDLHINIGIAEGFRREFGLLELMPCFGRINCEALESLRVTHGFCM